ncbi:UDP binding domain-containing protein [Sphingobacterium thermophilum]|uniref:UDP binding domain-containing protein n=1 Tax=Sphingobacterium thermophilum TaxID=768534 RepID=UPI0031E861D7
MRNTSVINIYKELLEYETQPAICDPWVDKKEVEDYYGVHLLDIERIYEDKYDAIIAAVAHDCFKDLELQKLQSDNCVIFDCKSIWNKEVSDTRL